MEWWSWISIGLVLLGAEMFVPTGMYLLIIGLSLLIMGGLTAAGITTAIGATSLEGQVLLATIISALMIFSVRNSVKKLFLCYAKKTKSGIADQLVTPLEDIPAGAQGRGELLGVPWSVRNNSNQNLTKGQSYSVTKVDGITLVIGE